MYKSLVGMVTKKNTWWGKEVVEMAFKKLHRSTIIKESVQGENIK